MEIKKYAAEFIGTFFLLFVGTGAIVVDFLSNGALGHMGVALSFGFIITVMVYACGHISGAHFNPAVTIAFTVVHKFPASQVVPYIISQLLGGCIASGILLMLFGNIENMGGTYPVLPVGQYRVAISFGVEFFFTFLLMFVIMGVATDSRAEGSFAGVAIGLAVLMGATVAGPISGGSFNPARSIAPAIVSGNYDQLWLYVVSPLLGAVCAAVTYQAISEQERSYALSTLTEKEIHS